MFDYTYSTHLCVTQKEMEATSSDMLVMVEEMGKNIQKHLGNIELGKSIRIFIHDNQLKTVGGIVGDLFGGWVYISLLWVDENIRNRGLGTMLPHQLELEAIHLGCKYAHVDMYSFEARPFYARSGYEIFAELGDYPVAYSKYFLKKSLV